MRLQLVALAAAGALVGCGGGNGGEDANRYVDAVNRAQTGFARTVERLSGRISDASSPAQDRRTLRSFNGAVSDVVADLRRIDPPPDVERLHRRLVADMGDYGTEVRQATQTLSSDDPRRLVAAQQRLLRATDTVSSQINETISAINRRLKGA
jgi:hypothetical protein